MPGSSSASVEDKATQSFKHLRGFVDLILNPTQLGEDPRSKVLERIRDAVTDLPRTVVVHVLSAKDLTIDGAAAIAQVAEEAREFGVGVSVRPVRPTDRRRLENLGLQNLMGG